MINFDSTVNTAVAVMVNGNAPGLTVIPDLALFLNGTLNPTLITVAYTGTGNIYNLTFTPQTTGIYNLYCFSEMQTRISVVTKSMYSSVQDIADSCLGSWQWDKTAGTLTLLRQDGTALGSYNVIDNLTSASRELI